MKLRSAINKYGKLILFITVFIVYGNTITNKYALDDSIVITENRFVQKGISGIKNIFTTESFTGFFGFDKKLVAGGRYRPLSIATFAVEHELFGKNPHISHFFNILFFSLIGILIYIILIKLDWFSKNIAFLITIIYILHPIHTEVIANIKGRDEILSLLFSLIAWYKVLQWQENKKNNHIIISVISLFLGMLAKENAITFVGIIPFSLFYKKINLKQTLKCFGILLVPALLFIYIRFLVLGGMQITQSTSLMNNPFIGMSLSQKWATIFFTWIWYIKLLVIPHPLTYDYYPYHVPISNFGNIIPYIGLIFYLSLIILAIYSLIKKRNYGFWIIFFLSAFLLMSNIFFSIGTFMNERFMFVSSLSYCVLIGVLIDKLNKHKLIKLTKISVAIIIILFSIKTIARNTTWKDNFTLFTHDVKISKNSAKGNCVAGGQYFEKSVNIKNTKLKNKYLRISKKYLKHSLDIYPKYNDAQLLYGNVCYGLHMSIDSVMKHYYSILKRASRHQDAWKNSIAVLAKGDYKKRLKWYNKLEKIDSTNFDVMYQKGLIFGKYMHNLKKSQIYLEKASKIAPNNLSVQKDLSVVYGMLGKYELSVKQLTKITKLAPNDARVWYNLGISLHNLKRYKEADSAFKKAIKLNPKLAKR